ncbi:DUF1275 family protein [Malacoplasma iowae]|uniref:DUF1275 domain-containing protein n=1 Tax=Malacoplasma iowae 695 TaxID=1048830 RepID=A0A6P1LIW5_MALIO|nr:DUF1275 family protein [Malacoplasma iowae]VEU61916.1 Predicted membrane protein [Mycoplasmopsis fermentans]EGZ31096.1 hypothetical protein GUU_03561 [Malacoplasma iowae 695]QHG90065.1 DUF1275 domain-containing protein [Malacoplasma iowae 695]WPL36202.1 DUF1275 family protein [Malacoplasma iowae]VEU70834.1 Predicted membrane protein [Malacoplasma iowae]
MRFIKERNFQSLTNCFYKNYLIILILAFVSGLLDFYMIKNYFIFVTTQTGNLVYFGLSLLNGQLYQDGFVYTFHNSYLYLLPFIVILISSFVFHFIDKKPYSIWFIYFMFALEIIYFVVWSIFANNIKLYIGNTNNINPVAILTIILVTIFISFHLTIFNQDKNVIYANVVSMGDIINASRSLHDFFVTKNKNQLLVFFKYMFIIILFVIAILFSYLLDRFLNFKTLYLIPLFILLNLIILWINHFKTTRYYIEL